MNKKPLLKNFSASFREKCLCLFLLLQALSASLMAQTPQVWLPTDKDPDYNRKKQEKTSNKIDTSASTKPVPKLTSAITTCIEPIAGAGWISAPRNDDGSVGPVELGWNFSLFGSIYNSVYINTNGNISFISPLSWFNPDGFPLEVPMIAAFWADVDTRAGTSGLIWYKVFSDRLVVIWDHVGYYNEKADKLNTFQLTIYANTSPTFTGNDVKIAYGDMQWTTGDASEGLGGFGGYPATVGANKGNDIDYIQTGRFNLNSSLAPNVGGVGVAGGVNWLDDKCFGYVVRQYEGNIPPAVAGWPSGDSITVYKGQTATYNFQFSGPEVGQNVSLTPNLGNLCSTTLEVTDNNTPNPNATLTITGNTCNLGKNTISIIATDNGNPQLSETFDLKINVIPCLTQAPPQKDTLLCYNMSGYVTLKGEGCNGTYRWYDDSFFGSFISESNTLQIYMDYYQNYATYYVSCFENSCESERVPYSVNILSMPWTSDASVCIGSSAELSGLCNGVVRWYDTSNSTMVHEGDYFVTPPIYFDTIYEAACYNYQINCENPHRAQVSVYVLYNSAPPTATGVTICSGNSVTLTASGCMGIYKWYDSYSSNTVLSYDNTFITPILTAPVSYYVSCTAEDCESSRTQVSVNMSTIIASPVVSGVSICAGASTTLTASGCSGTYRWYSSNTGTTILASTASYVTPALINTTTYYVSCRVNTCESSRVPATVSVNTSTSTPTAADKLVCNGTAAVLTASGCAGTYKWFASATGTTVLASTASYTTPALSANTTYFVSCTISNCEGTRRQVLVSVEANPAAPTASNVSICAGASATLTASGCTGTYRWYSSSTSTAILASTASYTTPALSSATSYVVRCQSTNCISSATTVSVSITAAPSPPTAPSPTICTGTAATLTASGCAGTYQWYASVTGTAVLASTATYTTPVLNATTLYSVTCKVGNCESSRTSVTVTVIAKPSPPTAPSTTICAGNTATLTASGCSGTYQWYASVTGTAVLASTATYTTPVLNATTLYSVTCKVGNCESNRTSVTVTVTARPSPPTAPGSTICAGSTATLTASGCTGTYQWYASVTGTAVLASTATYTTPVLTATTLYSVTCKVSNCESTRTSVTVTVVDKPAPPSAPGSTICTGSTASLTASGCSGTYQWYASVTGTAVLASTATYTTPVLTATTLYSVTCKVGNCESNRTSVTVTVVSSISAPTAPGTSVCSGNTATLTASGCSGTYRWYSSATSTAILASVNTYTSPALSASTSYYVACISGSCTSSRTQVNVSVSVSPPAPAASSLTVCAGSSATFSATGCSGTYSWYSTNSSTTVLSSGATYTTGVLSTTIAYYVSCKVSNCESSRTPVFAIVTPTSLILSGDAPSGVQQATQTIASTQIVKTGVDAIYKAGNSITLNPGFRADNSALFTAQIAACN